MCYHASLSADAPQLEKRYDAAFPQKDKYRPSFHANAFEFPAWPVVTRQEPGKLQLFSWGLIPRWAKAGDNIDELRARTLNAKSETLFEKPSFRQSISSGRRCLIPLTGFYEWHTLKSKKYPFYITSTEQPIVSVAGIWDEWTDTSTGEIIPTFSLLTTEANPLLARIHNTKQRMPALLTPEAEHAWLHDELTPEDVQQLTHTLYPAERLHSYSISKRITSRSESSDVPEVMEPASYPELAGEPDLFR
ncbi:SOS response-associated peptidase [Tellurirhabdus rosea]|uniref:SOS response-associated peptidase n=1 Tax=Tellurirhabdus rosea TaxID=2674997 RepID=UPI002255FF36|nr:SOS response-associated peptidase [Tellurirhabdus rosea]